MHCAVRSQKMADVFVKRYRFRFRRWEKGRLYDLHRATRTWPVTLLAAFLMINADVSSFLIFLLSDFVNSTDVHLSARPNLRKRKKSQLHSCPLYACVITRSHLCVPLSRYLKLHVTIEFYCTCKGSRLSFRKSRDFCVSVSAKQATGDSNCHFQCLTKMLFPMYT
jgi:hypothetical protein